MPSVCLFIMYQGAPGYRQFVPELSSGAGSYSDDSKAATPRAILILFTVRTPYQMNSLVCHVT